MIEPTTTRRVQIGDFTLDLDTSTLQGPPGESQLDPKDLSVLLHLLEHSPRVVTTDELLERSWPGTIVGDNALQQVITRLRKAFADDARSPTYIETQPRRGYRFMVPAGATVQIHSDATPPELTKKPIIPAVLFGVLLLAAFAWMSNDELITDQPVKVVAIFDLVDVSPGADHAWLAKGIAGELRQQIGNFRDFETVPVSLLRDRRISDLAGDVDIVVDGTVQARDGSIEVKLDAVDLQAEKSLWTLSFPGESDDLVQLQKHIATDVARVFNSTVFTTESIYKPSAPEAYEPFLKWVYHSHGGRPDDATMHLERALDADPDWTIGWLELGNLYVRLANFLNDYEYVEKARAALARAREIEPSWGGWLEGNIVGFYDGDLRRAEALFRGDEHEFFYVFLMLNSGLYKEVRDYHLRSTEMYPYNSGAWDHLGVAEIALGNFHGGIEASQRCAYLAPPRSYNCHAGQIYGLPGVELASAKVLMAEMLDTQKLRSPGSVTYKINRQSMNWLAFLIAIEEGRISDARERAFEIPDDRARTAVMLLMIGDEKWKDYAADDAELFDFTRYAFAYSHAGVAHHPAAKEYVEDAGARMGYTREWRLELCEKANLWPEESGIRCDPEDYR